MTDRLSLANSDPTANKINMFAIAGSQMMAIRSLDLNKGGTENGNKPSEAGRPRQKISESNLPCPPPNPACAKYSAVARQAANSATSASFKPVRVAGDKDILRATAAQDSVSAEESAAAAADFLVREHLASFRER